MNYKKVYEDLIQKRTVLQCLSENSIGCENHHIVPVSEGGSNDKDNIVRLTIKEHIFAHQLLARIYNDHKMWSAAHIMLFTKENIHNKCLRLAEEARQRIIEYRCNWHPSEETRRKMSEANKGERNGFYGKHHSEETRKRWSEKRKGKPPSKNAIIKMIESRKGKPAWNRGIAPSEETRRKISIGNKGKIVSLSTREKLSRALCGRKLSNAAVEKMRNTQRNTSKKRRSVVQYNLCMEVVAEYPSSREASRRTGISCGNISRCCNGKLNTVKGFIWRFK